MKTTRQYIRYFGFFTLIRLVGVAIFETVTNKLKKNGISNKIKSTNEK